jgi:hypothetical protein
MPTHWVIEIRLGTRADATPLRRAVVEAEDEAAALRLVLAQAELEVSAARAGLQDDGQEEVFSTAEASRQSEHHTGEEGRDQAGNLV